MKLSSSRDKLKNNALRTNLKYKQTETKALLKEYKYN